MTTKTTSFSQKAFKAAMFSLALIVVFIILKRLANAEEIAINAYSISSGICVLLVYFLTFMGFIYSIRSKNEPRSVLKISAIIINSILMALLIVTIIFNVLDLIKGMHQAT